MIITILNNANSRLYNKGKRDLVHGLVYLVDHKQNSSEILYVYLRLYEKLRIYERDHCREERKIEAKNSNVYYINTSTAI